MCCGRACVWWVWLFYYGWRLRGMLVVRGGAAATGIINRATSNCTTHTTHSGQTTDRHTDVQACVCVRPLCVLTPFDGQHYGVSMAVTMRVDLLHTQHTHTRPECSPSRLCVCVCVDVLLPPSLSVCCGVACCCLSVWLTGIELTSCESFSNPNSRASRSVLYSSLCE